jgi:hypothetical protein
MAARPGLHVDFRIRRQELRSEPDDPVGGTGDLQVCENLPGYELIYQNPPVLRVILKLDDVILAVVGFQQMGLCATSHLPDEPARVYGHGVRGKRKRSIELTPEETKSTGESAKEPAKNQDEIALELMRFIAVTTGYGKGSSAAAGFSGKPSKSAEEYADALIQLFERCRAVVAKPASGKP